MKHALRLPDLGSPWPAVVGQWLVREGARVQAGDHVLEVLLAEVLVDVAVPWSGVLCEKSVNEDDPVRAGDLLGYVQLAQDKAS